MSGNIWTPGASVPLVNAESTNLEQSFIASAGQSVFVLTEFEYVPGTSSLKVFVNGAKQTTGENFIETSSTSFTLLAELEAGESVVAEGIIGGTAVLSAKAYSEAAETSAIAAALSETNAAASEVAAALSETNADASEAAALLSAQQSASSALSASNSEANAMAYSSVGFNVSGTLYDFGLIIDPVLTFTTDYGSIV